MTPFAKKLAVFFPALVVGTLTVTAGCGTDRPEQPNRASKPTQASPRVAVQHLLAAHHLLGKQPHERTREEKKAKLDEQTLSLFFADSQDFEPFIADVYRGFVLGALTRHQNNLFIDTRGPKATVRAGDAAIVMRLEKDRWKVVLKESIPSEIEKRAARERARFEQALKNQGPSKP